MERDEIVAALGRQIGLYKHLGLEALEISGTRAVFRAPLADHFNHKGTAFGGSLYVVGVLAAYSLILALLKEAGLVTENIVIAKADVRYLRPVHADFEARCELSLAEGKDFLKQLEKQNRARRELVVDLLCEGQVCAELRGVFVVKN